MSGRLPVVPSASRPAVVLVHGIWMTGHEMAYLGRRLTRNGFNVYRFPYPARAATIAEHAARLGEFAARLPEPVVHFVAHSLGGRVVWHWLNGGSARRKPGRFIALGTPFLGSRVAARLARHRWGRWLLGRGGEDGLLAAVHVAGDMPAIGIIAGAWPYGVGRLLCRFREPNDGTVTIAETRLPGIAAHLTVNTSHLGLLFSPDVARNVVAFLATGDFADGAPGV